MMYFVRWIDSSLQDAEVLRHDLPTPTTIESVGHLTGETPEYVTLTRDLHDDGGHRGSLSIPRCAILDLEPLRMVDEEAEAAARGTHTSYSHE